MRGTVLFSLAVLLLGWALGMASPVRAAGGDGILNSDHDNFQPVFERFIRDIDFQHQMARPPLTVRLVDTDDLDSVEVKYLVSQWTPAPGDDIMPTPEERKGHESVEYMYERQGERVALTMRGTDSGICVHYWFDWSDNRWRLTEIVDDSM